MAVPEQITELAALTTPAAVDLLAIVDDPAGTPVTKKITVTDFFSSVPCNIRMASSNKVEFYSAGYFIRASTGLELQSVDLIRFLTNGATERMRILADGTVAVGIADGDGTFHVHTATAGAVAAAAGADDMVVENSGAGGLSVLVPDNVFGSVVFGSPSSNYHAGMLYKYDDGNLVFWASGAQQAYLAADGDLYLNTLLNENAFDEYDDNMILTGLRAMTVPDGHFLKERFSEWIEQAKPILEKTGIVNYEEDGQMFIASKKLQMLSIDAIRQLYDKVSFLEQKMEALDANPRRA